MGHNVLALYIFCANRYSQYVSLVNVLLSLSPEKDITIIQCYQYGVVNFDSIYPSTIGFHGACVTIS